MIFVYTGLGKGKTTAALGQAIRALGQKKSVLMIQFVKSRKFPSGEDKIISKFGSRFRLIKGGKGFVKILGDKLPFKTHKKAATGTLKTAQKAILSKSFDLVILDEINVALSLKLIQLREVLKILEKADPQTDIILTGRGADSELIKIADLATEFREIKHPFKAGITAEKGREF